MRFIQSFTAAEPARTTSETPRPGGGAHRSKRAPSIGVDLAGILGERMASEC